MRNTRKLSKSRTNKKQMKKIKDRLFRIETLTKNIRDEIIIEKR